MIWFVYIVRCADNTLYTGITADITRRVREHNGEIGTGARYTLSKRPVTLVYSKKMKSRSAALIYEAKIKKLSRDEKNAMLTV